MNLIIDIGNTIAKMAVFDGGRIVEVVYDSNLTLERLPEVCRTYTIEKAIVATVIDLSREVLSQLEDMAVPIVKELEDKSLLHMVVYGDEHEEIFNEVFKQLSGLRYGIVKSKTRSQTSIILFEAVSVGAALAYKSNKHINISKFYDWVNDKEFSNHITGATNSRKRVLARINYCRDKFLEK